MIGRGAVTATARVAAAAKLTAKQVPRLHRIQFLGTGSGSSASYCFLPLPSHTLFFAT